MQGSVVEVGEKYSGDIVKIGSFRAEFVIEFGSLAFGIVEGNVAGVVESSQLAASRARWTELLSSSCERRFR